MVVHVPCPEKDVAVILAKPFWSIKSQMSVIYTNRPWVEESTHWSHLCLYSGIPTSSVVWLFHHTQRVASVSETIAVILLS